MVPISVDKILVAGDLIEAYCVRDIGGQWKFSGDKHKSLQVDIGRTFHQ